MMEQSREDKTLLITLAATVALFVIGRFVGAAVFANGWSFAQWQGVPVWYIIVWFVGAALLAFVLGRFWEPLARLFESTRNVVIGGILLFAVMFVAQFNSFLFGAGNIAVARIAQTPDPIYRWFDYGSMALATILYRLYSLIGLQYNTAGVYAWKTIAFVCAALSMVASWKIAGALAKDPSKRLAAFVLAFFGPQLMLYFGFVGAAPVVVAFSLWFAYIAIRTIEQATLVRFAVLWLLVIVGVFFKATLIYLLPAAIFVSLAAPGRRRDSIPTLPIVIAAIVWVGALIALYRYAAGDLELKSAILLLAGKNPHSDYGLFSSRHIGDVLQILFLLFPLLIIAKAAAWRQLRSFFEDRRLLGLMFIWLGGFTALYVIDPGDGIVLDVPLLAAYLTSGGVILAALLIGSPSGRSAGKTTLGLICAAAIVLPLSYLPGYLNIGMADKPVQAYLDRHPAYYLTADPAMRDAYFYRKDLDQANWWDQNYIRLSPDYLQISGISDYANAGHTDDALRSLAKLIIRNPYWATARSLYASIQMQLQHYQLARPQLDTALMLAPYDRSVRINNYAWYRDTGSTAKALGAAREAAALFPSDAEIVSDVMLLQYRIGHVDTALAMADSLLAADSSLAYPYAVKAFVADRAGRLQEAIDNYEAFARRAPDDPQTPELRKRSNALYLQLHDKK